MFNLKLTGFSNQEFTENNLKEHIKLYDFIQNKRVELGLSDFWHAEIDENNDLIGFRNCITGQFKTV